MKPIGYSLLVLLLLVPRAEAQEPRSGESAAVSLARVPPGSTIRVQTVAGLVVEGPFRLTSDSVFLEGGDALRAIALADVRSAWYQQRRTRSGAVAGALIGGAAGGAFMGLLALVASATDGETVTLLAVGVLGGGAAGGLLGGVIGSAVPRWTLVYPVGAQPRTAAPAVTDRAETTAGRRRLGSFEGALGYGRIGADEPTNGGLGGRIALHADFGAEPRAGTTAPLLTVGPEIGWFHLGSTGLVRRGFASGDTLELSRSYSAFTAGGVVRGGLDGRTWRAYGLLGLAYNRWNIDERDQRWVVNPSPDPPVTSGESRFEHIGYTLGSGMQLTVAPRAVVGLELRHTAVGTFDMDLPGSYWTVTLTAVHRW